MTHGEDDRVVREIGSMARVAEQPYAQRIPWFTLDDLNEAQRELHTTFVRARRPGIADEDGRIIDPFNFFLLHPSLSSVLEQIGAQLRFRGVLPPKAMEVAILLVARAEGSSFIGRAHAAYAVSLGIDAEQVESLRQTGMLDGFENDVVAVGALAAELISNGDASDEAYEAACDAVGNERGLRAGCPDQSLPDGRDGAARLRRSGWMTACTGGRSHEG